MAIVGAKQPVRAAETAVQRTERAVLRRHRAIMAEQRHAGRSRPPSPADEARQFENYLALLTTVHIDCGPARDWKAIAMTAPPSEPVWVESESREAIARGALASYRPGFFEKLFGANIRIRAELEAAVHAARAADQDERGRALAAYRAVFEAWSTRTRLAQGVLGFDLNACHTALEQAGAFDELRGFGATVRLVAVEQARATLVHCIEDADVVPRREVVLSAGGSLGTRDIDVARRDALFKEHVCSCALRIAREVFAVLPVAAVHVRAELSRPDAGGVRLPLASLLGVQFERSRFVGLNFDAIQPAAAIASVSHRTSVPGAGGPEVVEPRQGTAGSAASRSGATQDPRSPPSPRAVVARVSGGIDRGAMAPAGPADVHRETDRDLESEFRVWLAAQIDGRASAQFKVKTLVNQLGRFRADRRLSFKAVQDLASALSSAGYDTEPDLDAMERSPGIEARVRVSRKLSPEQRRAKAFRDVAPSVALLRFLWGAGYRGIPLSTSVRPSADTPSVETAQALIDHVQRTSGRGLAVLEHLIVTGALESWLLDAQRHAVLAILASDLRGDAEAHKAKRWLAEAMRIVGARGARR